MTVWHYVHLRWRSGYFFVGNAPQQIDAHFERIGRYLQQVPTDEPQIFVSRLDGGVIGTWYGRTFLNNDRRRGSYQHSVFAETGVDDFFFYSLFDALYGFESTRRLAVFYNLISTLELEQGAPLVRTLFVGSLLELDQSQSPLLLRLIQGILNEFPSSLDNLSPEQHGWLGGGLEEDLAARAQTPRALIDTDSGPSVTMSEDPTAPVIDMGGEDLTSLLEEETEKTDETPAPLPPQLAVRPGLESLLLPGEATLISPRVGQTVGALQDGGEPEAIEAVEPEGIAPVAPTTVDTRSAGATQSDSQWWAIAVGTAVFLGMLGLWGLTQTWLHRGRAPSGPKTIAAERAGSVEPSHARPDPSETAPATNSEGVATPVGLDGSPGAPPPTERAAVPAPTAPAPESAPPPPVDSSRGCKGNEVDLDEDGYRACRDGTPMGGSSDCDDRDPEVHPGAEERCVDKDYDCDGDPWNGWGDANGNKIPDCREDAPWSVTRVARDSSRATKYVMSYSLLLEAGGCETLLLRWGLGDSSGWSSHRWRNARPGAERACYVNPVGSKGGGEEINGIGEPCGDLRFDFETQEVSGYQYEWRCCFTQAGSGGRRLSMESCGALVGPRTMAKG